MLQPDLLIQWHSQMMKSMHGDPMPLDNWEQAPLWTNTTQQKLNLYLIKGSVKWPAVLVIPFSCAEQVVFLHVVKQKDCFQQLLSMMLVPIPLSGLQ